MRPEQKQNSQTGVRRGQFLIQHLQEITNSHSHLLFSPSPPKKIEKFFFPLFVNEREEVPERCPFKRSRDAYREIESMKMRKYNNKRRNEDEWKDVGSGKVSSQFTHKISKIKLVYY